MSYSQIIKEDFSSIISNYNFAELKNSSFFITGATGLVGKQVALFLDYLNTNYSYNIKIIPLVRNLDKAKTVLGCLESQNLIRYAVGDVKNLPAIDEKIDYIIHGASITSSKMFVESPVETIDIALNGTMNVLNFAKEKNVKSVVYLSSMEAFGVTNPEMKEVREEDLGYIDPLNVRSSYSEGKRMCECLCASFSSEYKVPVKIARLAQTFGPGIAYDDSRVCAMFARSVIESKDIVLKTKGLTKRPALYTKDAVGGLLILLLKGQNGQCYTVANPETFWTIKDIAKMVANKIADGKISLKFDLGGKNVFAPDLNMNLSAEKLMNLGWKPTVGLEEAYRRMISYMKEIK